MARVRMAYQEARYGRGRRRPACPGAVAGGGQSRCAGSLSAAGSGGSPRRSTRSPPACCSSSASCRWRCSRRSAAASEAEASGDPLVVAASARCTAQALQRSGHHAARAGLCAVGAARGAGRRDRAARPAPAVGLRCAVVERGRGGRYAADRAAAARAAGRRRAEPRKPLGRKEISAGRRSARATCRCTGSTSCSASPSRPPRCRCQRRSTPRRSFSRNAWRPITSTAPARSRRSPSPEPPSAR